MLMPLLIKLAMKSNKLEVDDNGRHLRLVTKTLGLTIVLAKIEREAFYQLVRMPGMPATYAEAMIFRGESMDFVEGEKVVADEPVPLPTVRQKPLLQVIQGGQA